MPKTIKKKPAKEEKSKKSEKKAINEIKEKEKKVEKIEDNSKFNNLFEEDEDDFSADNSIFRMRGVARPRQPQIKLERIAVQNSVFTPRTSPVKNNDGDDDIKSSYGKEDIKYNENKDEKEIKKYGITPMASSFDTGKESKLPGRDVKYTFEMNPASHNKNTSWNPAEKGKTIEAKGFEMERTRMPYETKEKKYDF